MSTTRYLTAREAAEELGVRRKTLYAYVSRGLIRSEDVGGGRRKRRYRAEDVRRLKERKEQRRDPTRASEGALDWRLPVTESAITLIADGRMYYRGRDALVLSGDHSLEQVAELIWTGRITPGDREQLPELFRMPAELVLKRAGFEGEMAGLRFPVEAFGMTLQWAAATDSAAYVFRPAAVARTGALILRLLVATAVGGRQTSAEHTVAQTLQRRWVPGEAEAAKLFDRALVLCADHELNVSAFTARCVASAGATPYAVVVGGLAALGGVKHGGNTERVEAFLVEARADGDAREAVASRLRRGEALPGFGHRLYPEGDPRGKALLAALYAEYPGAAPSELARDVARAVEELTGEKPNVDFALVVLARVLDLPPGGPLALFALGRTVGWVGHAIEQYGMDRIIRPRARYVGEQPEDA